MDAIKRAAALKRFQEELAKDPSPIPDDEWMAMYEASDEDYKRGPGVTLPAVSPPTKDKDK